MSDYEIDVARAIHSEFGHMTGERLTRYLHKNAREWIAPEPGSSHPINPAEILRAGGRTEAEITAIAAEAAYFRKVELRFVV
jgi:hypothetical protein